MTPIEIKDRVRDEADKSASVKGDGRGYEENYFHDYFRRMPFAAVEAMLRSAAIDLNGKLVHVAGCGNGIDVFHLKRMYPAARLFATDLSARAVAGVCARFRGTEGRAEDLEALSFADDSFDWSFVAAALHHLPRPVLGLYELLRVSREGVIFIEPHDSWLVRRFMFLGLAQEYERVGNYVFRWSRADVDKLCRSLYCSFRCTTLFATHRVARTRLEFELLRALNCVATQVMPAAGNYMICCIQKVVPPGGRR